jgi:hypothetical protein
VTITLLSYHAFPHTLLTAFAILKGRAVVRELSRWAFIAEVSVQSQTSPFGILGKQSDTGTQSAQYPAINGALFFIIIFRLSYTLCSPRNYSVVK